MQGRAGGRGGGTKDRYLFVSTECLCNSTSGLVEVHNQVSLQPCFRIGIYPLEWLWIDLACYVKAKNQLSIRLFGRSAIQSNQISFTGTGLSGAAGSADSVYYYVNITSH